jgi:hypothetical protein
VLLFECAQVRTLADAFLREAQRHYYATPTSYLELIQTYKELLTAKRTSVGNSNAHGGAGSPCLITGYDKLCSATQCTVVFVEGCAQLRNTIDASQSVHEAMRLPPVPLSS